MKTVSGKYAEMITVAGVSTFLIFPVLPQEMLSSAYLPENKCSCFVYISGSSNINKFDLRLEFPDGHFFSVGDITDSTHRKDRLYIITIPVNLFKADNKLIYNDFVELLKADQYRDITIEIPYDHLWNVFSGMECTQHLIKITLAGVTNSYIIPSSFDFCNDSKIFISGTRGVRLMDFNLTPPEKLKGLIKVADELVIDFGFVFYITKNRE